MGHTGMTSTPLHHTNPNGKVGLSPRVLIIDNQHKIYRRPRTWRDRAVNIFFLWVVPALALAFALVCWGIVFWAGAAILRAIGR
jgi:hypothetical protein